MEPIQEQFSHIISLIRDSRSRVYHAVNQELILLYWQIGAYVSQQVAAKAWGKSVVKELADFITHTEPNIIGFSPQNIWRMKQFYETYNENPKLYALCREISWTHQRLLLACRTEEEREFYLRLSIKEKWSYRQLERQINSSYFERVMIGNEKLSATMRELPQQITDSFKDSYVLEFLNLSEKHLEKDLKKQITQNITKFLMELGRDFAFMGEEYPIQVGNQDFAVDLVFYNRSLNCMIAIELKTVEFHPSHLGQINFYLEALDRDVRKPHENPPIGILLCKGKDDTVVEYALSRSLSPTLVADYQTKLPDKKLLQAKWEQILEEAERSKED